MAGYVPRMEARVLEHLEDWTRRRDFTWLPLMKQLTFEIASDLLLARLRHGGVDVRMSEEVAAAIAGPDGRINSVALRSGGKLPCDLLAVAIGVICNSEVVAKSGITLGANGGIVVDDGMRTNVPNIFAAGDVATFEGRLLQLWEPARVQGRIAAINMVGVDAHSKSGRGVGRSASTRRSQSAGSCGCRI